MRVGDRYFRTLWPKEERSPVLQIIDQRQLPHEFVIEDLLTIEDTALAISEMHVRGAGLIGATAAYGMYQAACEGRDLGQAAEFLQTTRPTAMNLRWAVLRMLAVAAEGGDLYAEAMAVADEDAAWCRQIGEHGVELVATIAAGKKDGAPVNILTHCNAGWLAFVDHGTATAPIYAAHEQGINVHVWVDETRPRNQGAALTMWELMQHGVPCTLITDNTGGHLMQHGMVDICFVGSDRTTRGGDVGNKIGTYLKALAANDNGVPFYAALPSSTVDWELLEGVGSIPIEQRDNDEVLRARGLYGDEIIEPLLAPAGAQAANYAFDVTPARLVSGIITERGICTASEEGFKSLFPEKFS
ncbi:MAG: S-methyl-5-thioribose-1-phosphate isomerase [Gammaproteobacteria bacterium]|jgi:methylthioribose-1-phosphate isomerase